MSNWQKVKIGDFFKRIKRPIKLEKDKNYKLVTIKMHHNGIVLREEKQGSLIKSNMYEVYKGDFILSGIDARNGAFGIIPEALDKAIVTNDFWYFELDENIVNKYFFLELTATSWFDDICKKGSDGTTQRIRLQKDKFFNQEIVLPSLEEQIIFIEKFKQIKSTKEDLESEISTQQSLLKQLKQTILQEAIEGKLTAKWRAQNTDIGTAKELLEKIKIEKEKLIKEKKIKASKTLSQINGDEMPFDIPQSWEWCRLGDIGHTQTGNTPSTLEKNNFGNDIPFIKPADITNSSIDYENEGLSLKGLEGSRFIPYNSILMVCIGGSIGKSYINNINVACNQQINTITPYGKISPFQLQYQMQSIYFQTIIWDKASIGGTPILNKSKWENIPIPLAPLEEQKEILATIEKLFTLCDELEGEINQNKTIVENLMATVLKEAFEN